MASGRDKKTKYYAVIRGRLDEPTIFSSWGDVHPRVTGLPNAKYQGFPTIEEARAYMNGQGVAEPKEVIKDGAEETTPLPGSQPVYAVAHGKRPGIYEKWEYEYEFRVLSGCSRLLTSCSEVQRTVKFSNDACYKKFSTRAQAKAFMEDWRDAVADVWRRAIREGLDQGREPCNMKFSVEGILRGTDGQTKAADVSDAVKVEKPSLEKE